VNIGMIELVGTTGRPFNDAVAEGATAAIPLVDLRGTTRSVRVLPRTPARAPLPDAARARSALAIPAGRGTP
jgi:hypothetical protein